MQMSRGPHFSACRIHTHTLYTQAYPGHLTPSVHGCKENPLAEIYAGQSRVLNGLRPQPWIHYSIDPHPVYISCPLVTFSALPYISYKEVVLTAWSFSFDVFYGYRWSLEGCFIEKSRFMYKSRCLKKKFSCWWKDPDQEPELDPVPYK